MAHKNVGSEAAGALARTLQGPWTTESNAPLPVTAVAGFLARITTAVLPTSASGLVGLLKVTTLLINALTCLQARAQAALLATRRVEAKDDELSLRPVRGAVIQEIGLACRLSPYQAAEHLKRATTLPTRLPRTWAQWRSGEMAMDRAAAVIKETQPLDAERAAHVDAEVATGLGNRSKREADHVIRTAVIEADPQAAAERARMAHDDRYASARPAGDGMITFHALVPGLEGQAIWTGLEERATAIRNSGDERSKEQIKADTFVEALISYLVYLSDTDSSRLLTTGPPTDAGGGHRISNGFGTDAAAEAGTGARAVSADGLARAKRPRPAVQIQLVMTDAALFGFSDTPARAHGLGPVPAALARDWAREAIEDERAELIRLYTTPGTGHLVGMDSKRRTFPKSLARYVATRDEICRTPWCGAPIKHIDHITPHSHGGPPACPMPRPCASSATSTRTTPAGSTKQDPVTGPYPPQRTRKVGPSRGSSRSRPPPETSTPQRHNHFPTSSLRRPAPTTTDPTTQSEGA